MNYIELDSILLVYYHAITENAPTIKQHLHSFLKFSRYTVVGLNLEYGFPEELQNYSFKVIVLHYSLFGSYPFPLNERLKKYLINSNSHKIAFFQDEYQFCQERFSIINELKIDSIYSLLNPMYFEQVYKRNTNVKDVYYTLTGYVDEELIEISKRFFIPWIERPIDVGYRARPLSYFMGKGAQEKTDIAIQFLKLVESEKFSLDIKWGEKDRIYGEDWFRFVANCKAMLGVEAGVSIFDIDGSAKKKVEQLLQKNPDYTFQEIYDLVLKDYEDNIQYRTISPRIFEAAAFRVLMILFEGEYSGILKPYIHYIPLKKDFSNLQEALKIMQDQDFVEKILQNAYNDLILSGSYTFQKFIAGFDENLKKYISDSHSKVKSEKVRLMIQNYCKKREKLVKLKSLLYKDFPGKKMLKKIYYLIKK